MNNITLGEKICALRKDRNMTQAQLAELMNVTDKAVSKWERNLSCPDINSLPKLARIFEVSVDELITERHIKEESKLNAHYLTILLILKSVALGMGVAVTVLTFMAELGLGQTDMQSILSMLGIGLTCLSLVSFQK